MHHRDSAHLQTLPEGSTSTLDSLRHQLDQARAENQVLKEGLEKQKVDAYLFLLFDKSDE